MTSDNHNFQLYSAEPPPPPPPGDHHYIKVIVIIFMLVLFPSTGLLYDLSASSPVKQSETYQQPLKFRPCQIIGRKLKANNRHLESQLASRRSNQSFDLCYWSWIQGGRCWSCWWSGPARRSRRSSPSRLSRHRLGSSGSQSDRKHGTQRWKQWTGTLALFLDYLLLSLSSCGFSGICRDSLVSWEHLLLLL